MIASTLEAPAFEWSPPYVKTLGPEVAELATLAGFAPDPEQSMALDVIFGEDKYHRPTAHEFCVICSRQNLKTGLFKQAALGWLFITDQRLVVWSAHEFATAQEAFRDMATLIESTPVLDAEVKHIHRGNGEEAIELRGDRRLMFRARTQKGGRGLTGDKVVLDEGFALQQVHMGALIPMLATRPDAQVLYGSSAGQVQSEVLRGIRDRGRPGGDPRLAYLEWCDPEPGGCATSDCKHGLNVTGCALDDRARWRKANPAMGRRITEDYIAGERRMLPPGEFARERLGWWDDPDIEGRVISPALWSSCAQDGVTPDTFTLAVDVSPMQDWAAIAAAWTVDGVTHVEVTGTERQVDHREGTTWVVPRLGAMALRHKAKVAIAAGSQATALVPDLERAGVQVEVIKATEVTSACGSFYNLATDARLAHHSQEPLDRAVANAQRKDVGDGAWVWGRRKSPVDITPLYAATLAAWAAGKPTIRSSMFFAGSLEDDDEES